MKFNVNPNLCLEISCEKGLPKKKGVRLKPLGNKPVFLKNGHVSRKKLLSAFPKLNVVVIVKIVNKKIKPGHESSRRCNWKIFDL